MIPRETEGIMIDGIVSQVEGNQKERMDLISVMGIKIKLMKTKKLG